jgi:hypothetical protein
MSMASSLPRRYFDAMRAKASPSLGQMRPPKESGGSSMRLQFKYAKYKGDWNATAINEGQGGPDAFHRNLNYKGDWNATFKEIDAFFARLPKLDSEYFPDGMEQTLELWCGKQLDRHLAKRDLYRLFKTKILYTEDGSTMYTTGFENNARIKVREPSATILNDLPFEEALEIYMGENV